MTVRAPLIRPSGTPGGADRFPAVKGGRTPGISGRRQNGNGDGRREWETGMGKTRPPSFFPCLPPHEVV